MSKCDLPRITFGLPFSFTSFLYGDWSVDNPEAYITVLRLVFDEDLRRKLKTGEVVFPGDGVDKRLILSWNAAFFREKERIISYAKTRRQKGRLERAGTAWTVLDPPELWANATSAPTPPRLPAVSSIDSASSAIPPAGDVAAAGIEDNGEGATPSPVGTTDTPPRAGADGAASQSARASSKVNKIR